MTESIKKDFYSLLRTQLGDNLIQLILFGSQARGTGTETSDYDFLVIVSQKNKQIEEIVLDAAVSILNAHDALINYLIWDIKEVERKKHFPIGINIFRDGVVVE